MRFVKGGVSRALRTLRAGREPGRDRVVPLSPQMVAAVCAGVTAAPSGACGPMLPRRRRDASATPEPAERRSPRPPPAHEKQPPRSPGVAATLERDRLDAAILRGRGQSAMGDAPSAPQPAQHPGGRRAVRPPPRATPPAI